MDDSRPLNKELSTQLAISGASELIGMAVAIGSVLLARKAMPEQVKQLERMFSRFFAKWHGGSPETMAQAGIKATDFLLMNIGGAANMASQFTLHRIKTPEHEKLPLAEEALRIITGRLAGTVGAASMVALAEHHAGGTLRRTEQAIGRLLPFDDKMMVHGRISRISPLILSSLIQSVGALGPNVAAQVLFDHLVKRKPDDEGKGK